MTTCFFGVESKVVVDLHCNFHSFTVFTRYVILDDNTCLFLTGFISIKYYIGGDRKCTWSSPFFEEDKKLLEDGIMLLAEKKCRI